MKGASAILDSGPTVEAREVKFAKDWLVAHSNHASGEEEISAEGPPLGTLDFALVRLAEPVGTQAIGTDNQRKDASPRGRHRLDGNHYDFLEDEVMLIIGHSAGRPIQLSFGCPSGAKLTKSASRVRYSVNTDHGSSGSPVFNKNWRVVALHHAFGPTATSGESTRDTNQGVPIRAVADELRTQLAGKQELSELDLT